MAFGRVAHAVGHAYRGLLTLVGVPVRVRINFRDCRIDHENNENYPPYGMLERCDTVNQVKLSPIQARREGGCMCTPLSD